ncbi:MAG: OB-fold nucleic acid binding domain-containing protein [Candidatus Aenigmatarchaeota archaeon]
MNHIRVKNLISSGFLVNGEIASNIEALSEDDFLLLQEKLKKEKAFVLSKELINRLLTKEIEILSQFKPVEAITIQDFVKTLNERYSFLQGILLDKVELKNIVSINKAGNGDVSIIGLVKEISEKDSNTLVVLEDPTGSIETVIDKKIAERLCLDDVVAVTGKINNRTLSVDKLLFPNIPLRPVNYSKESVRIAFSENGKKIGADYVIYKNKIRDNIKNKSYEISCPCFVKIKNVTVLVVFNTDPINLLNKRYANICNRDLLVKTIPDILFTNNGKNMSYKGVSIVSLDNVIDLKTREVKQV